MLPVKFMPVQQPVAQLQAVNRSIHVICNKTARHLVMRGLSRGLVTKFVLGMNSYNAKLISCMLVCGHTAYKPNWQLRQFKCKVMETMYTRVDKDASSTMLNKANEDACLKE